MNFVAIGSMRQPQSTMSEWAKILISTVVGFSAALLIEPIKYRLSIWLTSRRAEKEINRELGRIYHLFCIRTGEEELAYWVAFRSKLTEVFDYYFEHHREAIYAIKWYERYQGFYEGHRTTRELLNAGKITVLKAVEYVRDEFQFRFDTGLLSKQTVCEYADGFGKTDKSLLKHESFKKYEEARRKASAGTET